MERRQTLSLEVEARTVRAVEANCAVRHWLFWAPCEARAPTYQLLVSLSLSLCQAPAGIGCRVFVGNLAYSTDLGAMLCRGFSGVYHRNVGKFGISVLKSWKSL